MEEMCVLPYEQVGFDSKDNMGSNLYLGNKP